MSVSSVVGDGAAVSAPFQVHVALLSPLVTPPVSEDPGILRVADQEHRVVHEVR